MSAILGSSTVSNNNHNRSVLMPPQTDEIKGIFLEALNQRSTQDRKTPLALVTAQLLNKLEKFDENLKKQIKAIETTPSAHQTSIAKFYEEEGKRFRLLLALHELFDSKLTKKIDYLSKKISKNEVNPFSSQILSKIERQGISSIKVVKEREEAHKQSVETQKTEKLFYQEMQRKLQKQIESIQFDYRDLSVIKPYVENGSMPYQMFRMPQRLTMPKQSPLDLPKEEKSSIRKLFAEEFKELELNRRTNEKNTKDQKNVASLVEKLAKAPLSFDKKIQVMDSSHHSEILRKFYTLQEVEKIKEQLKVVQTGNSRSQQIEMTQHPGSKNNKEYVSLELEKLEGQFSHLKKALETQYETFSQAIDDYRESVERIYTDLKDHFKKLDEAREEVKKSVEQKLDQLKERALRKESPLDEKAKNILALEGICSPKAVEAIEKKNNQVQQRRKEQLAALEAKWNTIKTDCQACSEKIAGIKTMYPDELSFDDYIDVRQELEERVVKVTGEASNASFGPEAAIGSAGGYKIEFPFTEDTEDEAKEVNDPKSLVDNNNQLPSIVVTQAKALNQEIESAKVHHDVIEESTFHEEKNVIQENSQPVSQNSSDEEYHSVD